MDFPLKNMFDAFKDDIWEGKTASIVLYYVIKVNKIVSVCCFYVAREELCWTTLHVHVHVHVHF